MLAVPVLAQIAPLVPLDDHDAEVPMAAGITHSPPEIYGQYAQVWALEDGAHVMQYYGDFSLHLGARRLSSRDAVAWMQKTTWKGLSYYHYEVFLSQEAMVRDAAGTINSGPTLLVTFNSYSPPKLEMDSSSAEPSADTTLYREASRVRDQVMAGRRGTGEPGDVEVIDPETQNRREPAKPLPLVRYRSTDAIIDEKAGTVVITGNVYLSRGLDDSDTFVEVRANAAVIFRAREPGKPQSTTQPDVLSMDTPDAQSPTTKKPGSTETAGALGVMGGGMGSDSGVAGVYLKGDVVLTRGDRMIRAAELYYDLENDRALILDAVMRTTIPDRELPLYIRAEQIRQLSSTEFQARKARVSTSEFYTPHVHLGAEEITLIDATPRGETGEMVGLEAGRYRAHDVTLNSEGIPFAYWPYSEGDFRRGESALRSARLSYGDDFGMSVETRWYLFNLLGVEAPKGVDAILRADYFSKRGPGTGLNVFYETEHSRGLLDGYYVHDRGEDDLGSFREDTDDQPNRGRLTWRHMEFLPDNWRLTLEGSYVSDPTFLEEWFNNEFEEGKEQETLAYLKKQENNWAFALLAQWRILDFLAQTEHLPDASFHWIGEPLGDLANYYNESHMGLVHRRVDERQLFDQDLFDRSRIESDLTVRADTRNELTLPIRLGNAQVVPYAMARTGYWDGSMGEGSVGRMLGSVGIRTGTQFWKVFEGVTSKLLDLYGLRHIITPEMTAWMSSSNVDSINMYQFDRGIEDIDDFYGASLALRQRWQTKRGGPGNWRVVDWIKLDLELNVFGGVPELNDNRSIGRFYSYRPEASSPRNHVRSDFSIRLSDTATLLADANWNLNDGSMDLLNLSYAVEHTPRFSYVLGYRRIGPTDSNLIGGGTNYQFNTKYSGSVRAYYDIEYNKLAEFDVTIVRRWPRWYTALTFGLDNIEDDISLSLSVWPEGAPGLALGSRRYTGMERGTGIRPEE